MAEQRLWAPWRMKYLQAEPKDEDCIFCLAAQASEDEHRYVLRRGERCLVMLNAFPYNSGHLMVSPHRYVPSVEDLDPGELLELMTLAQRALRPYEPPTTPTASTSASMR
jgi:ATP adenylyltransferase